MRPEQDQTVDAQPAVALVLLDRLCKLAAESAGCRIDFNNHETVCRELERLPGAHVSEYYSRDALRKRVVTEALYTPVPKVRIFAQRDRLATAEESARCDAALQPWETVRILRNWTVSSGVPETQG